MNLIEIKNKLYNQINLSSDESALIFEHMMSGNMDDIDMTAILILLKLKKETKDEILGAVKIMREKSLKISSPLDTIDTCGTGGDMSGTLNISTSAALIAASAGAKVAKHGNRSISSKSGSADMLDKLGIKITSDIKKIENNLKNNNFCFMFAQYHHDAMKHIIKVRKQLSTRTIFNLLGPLTNPASTKKQLLGVFDKRLVRIHCEVLRDLGSSHAMVVHGKDGLDEISLSEPTYISELKNGNIKDYVFNPQEYGFSFIDKKEILGKDPEYNAKSFIELLDAPNNGFQKIVEINAGATLYLSGISKNLQDGFDLAKHVITKKISKNYFNNLLENQ